jgi:nitrogen fixation/metabolism regulation signal transduction histidine kinase
MLLVLTRRAFEPDQPALEQEFQQALARAYENITEPGEVEVLDQLKQSGLRALAGDPAALRQTVEGIRRLVTINREAMLRADHEARRLGTAGAWAAVFLALAALAATVVVGRRLAGRIFDPLAELYEVTEAVRAGDRFRRCRRMDASPEMVRLVESVNFLLDQRDVSSAPASPDDDESRAVALHFLSQRAEAAFVVDRAGEVAMANSVGLESLRGSDGEALRRALSTASTGESREQRLDVQPIRDADLWLCIVR